MPSPKKKILAFHPKRSSYAKTSHALMIIIATPQALKMLRGKVAIFKLLLNKVIKLNLQWMVISFSCLLEVCKQMRWKEILEVSFTLEIQKKHFTENHLGQACTSFSLFRHSLCLLTLGFLCRAICVPIGLQIGKFRNATVVQQS